MGIEIASMQKKNWGVILDIYTEGIATGNATFETEAPDWKTWNANREISNQ